VTGQREIVLMSAAEEASAGRQAAEEVEQQIGLVEDPELVALVERIGERLARHSPRADVPYRFAIADMAEPNAFALPGGWVYVSRGLLAIANSEDELANVVGHEIGHVAARHAAQRQTRAAGAGLLAALGTVVAGVVGGAGAAQAVSSLGQVAGAGYIASYSRDQERQADEVGQSIAAQAGYDPMAMADFLATLGRDDRLRRSGETRRPSFLDSHPLTSERVSATQERARGLAFVESPGEAGGHAAFLHRLEGILVGENPREGAFEGDVFVHPGLDFRIAFPRGWHTENGRDAVAAQAPGQDALVILEAQGPREDPASAARRFAQANGLALQQGGRTRVGGLDAFRALATAQSSSSGPLGLDLVWIAHPRATLRLTGVAGASRYAAYAPVFEEVARSFRPLAPAEREGVTELRLAVVEAQAGETLAALGARTGNAWTPAETAVANALEEGAVLRAGAPIKTARRVPFAR
jgi:predicted Zn-dependent protease